MAEPRSQDEMTANVEQLEVLASVVNDAIEETRHPYEHATETEREDYERRIETVANQREVRERAAASTPE